MTWLVRTGIGGRSEVLSQSYVDTSALLVSPLRKFPFKESEFDTTIVCRVGPDARELGKGSCWRWRGGSFHLLLLRNKFVESLALLSGVTIPFPPLCFTTFPARNCRHWLAS